MAACDGRLAGARARPLDPAAGAGPDGAGGSSKPGFAFDTPEEGVAPGQACVLYAAPDAQTVLGGGFIIATVSAAERLTSALNRDEHRAYEAHGRAASCLMALRMYGRR